VFVNIYLYPDNDIYYVNTALLILLRAAVFHGILVASHSCTYEHEWTSSTLCLVASSSERTSEWHNSRR